MSSSTQTVEAVFFDLDGTLIDTALDFIAVVNAMRTDDALPPLAPALIRAHVSDGARALTKLAFGGSEGEQQFEARKAELLRRYEQCAGDACRLFPGFNDVLETFNRQAIPWGIVTNKPRLYTDIILEKLQLIDNCAVSVCPDEVSLAKPDPEGLLIASRKCNVKPEHSVYVGDHVRDIQAGANADMTTVAVRFGYLKSPDEADTWNADFVIDSPSELLKITNQT